MTDELMKLDPAALEVAKARFRDFGWAGTPAGFPEAIRAYLSATPAQTKGDDLVERFTPIITHDSEGKPVVAMRPSVDGAYVAASRIQSLTASNEALETENNRLQGKVEDFSEREGNALNDLETAQAEIARMREALGFVRAQFKVEQHRSGSMSISHSSDALKLVIKTLNASLNPKAPS